MSPRKRKGPPAETTVHIVSPSSIDIGGGMALPGGVMFAMQADRPEMLTPGLCGVAAGVAGWNVAEQTGVLALLADVVRHRGELREQVKAARRDARRARAKLHRIALFVADEAADASSPGYDDDDDDDDEEDDE